MSPKTTSIFIGGLACALLGTLLAMVNHAVTPVGQTSVAGIIIGILSCFTAFTSGFIAVWHYTGEHELTLRGRQGVGLGALAGIVGAVISLLVTTILRMANMLPDQEEFMEMMRESGQLDGPGPQFAETIASVMFGPLSIVIGVIVGVITGLIGGAIGAAVFKRGSDDIVEDY